MPSRAITHFPQQFLDLYSIKELPDTHKWGPLNDHDHDHKYNLHPNNTCDLETVPFIDLNDENAVSLIGQACKTWGVFQIMNHNVSEDLLKKIERAGSHLFSLPLHEKLRAARAPDGVSGYGVARISSFFPKHMWSEGFTIVDSPLEHACLLWPNDYYEFCETIESYKKAMKDLADRMMWLMLSSLGISKTDIKWADSANGIKSDSDSSGVLQLNSYPACPDPEQAMGMAAHTDSTILTILHQSNISGLQALRQGSEQWTTIPPRRGALVINVGDLMHMLTNGAYRGAVHRALVNRNMRRLSVVYLYGPPASAKIAPVTKLVGEGRPPLYRAVTWSEYLGLKSKYFDKALGLVRLTSEEQKGGGDDNDDHTIDVYIK